MNCRILFIGLILISLCVRAGVPGDEHWDVRFGASGAENTVFATLRHGNDIYIGGIFSFAGDVNATNIARWDGTDWHAIGPGIGTAGGGAGTLWYVYSLATDGNDIYAGGYFTNSGSTRLTSTVVRWDGTQWSEVGNLRGVAIHLQFSGGTLYAAGSLGFTGDTNTYAVARWDGSSWDTMGSVVSGCVGQFCVPAAINLLIQGSEIYAVGQFTSIGGVAANAAAKWDGFSWSPLGTGFGGTNVLVSGIVMHNGQLYVSGLFQTAGGLPAQNMAVWNGSNWQPFSGANDEVRRLLSDGISMYAAGSFTNIGGTAANRTARWNGASWTPLGTGVSSGLLEAVLNESELIVGGQFIMAGSAPAATVARWDGTQWFALNSGRQNGMNLPLGVVRALDVLDEYLYAGGDFIGAGPILRSKIARWDGNAWSSIGSGIIGPSSYRVRAITHTTTDLYVGGTFTNAGGGVASNIARWNGSTWSALGSGVNSNVHALASDNSSVFAGGAFTTAGGFPAGRFAWWNGSAWSTLGSGANSNVNALLMWNGRLIVGGQFTSVSGFAINKLAEFTPLMAVPWRPIGGNVFPTGGNVLTLAVSGTNLFVAGNFVIPGINATNIARWDGVSWSALARGLLGRTTSPINALAVRGHELFAAGTLTNAGGLPVQAIARWDGTNWHALGSGVQMNPGNPTISALAIFQDSLYVGGLFQRAGGRVSVCIARWIPDIHLEITGSSYTPNEVRVYAQPTLGLKLRLDGSSDLNTWIPVQRQHGYSTATEFVDDAPPTDRRIYRVVAEP